LNVYGSSQISTTIQNRVIQFKFFVVKDLGKDVILGSDFLSNIKARWNFEASTLEFEGHKIELQNKGHNLDVASITKESLLNKLSHLKPDYVTKFSALLQTNINLFSKSETDVGKTSLVKMTINTGESHPIKQKPYKTPFSLRPEVDRHIKELLKAKIIRPSTSPWASPIIIVPKKDGGSRMCIDFRKLNCVTTNNSYPLPSISDILASLKNARYFSCLDLKSGYYQIEMSEADKEKTAFVCHKGLFEFNVMPFGLSSAPPVFQELMNRVLGDSLNDFAFAYLDDIIIYSHTLDDHMAHLQKVFTKLKDANLKLKLSKCDFGVSKVGYLGHEISAQGVKPDPAKVQSIRQIAVPTTVKQVCSFLGLVGFYHQFIKNFAEIAHPLTQLTRKYCRFRWNPDCQRAFETLKESLCQNVVLAHPDQSRPYTLYADASQYAVGAVLTQTSPDGEKVIQFLSKQLNDCQKKWATIEKEAYAIVYACDKLRHYLYGADFKVVTDHKPLRSLFTAEMRNARIQRWAVKLSEYGCRMEYLSGKENVPADALSRIEGEQEVIVIDSTDVLWQGNPASADADEDEAFDTDQSSEGPTDVKTDDLQLEGFDLRAEQIKDPEINGLINLISQGHDVSEHVMDDGVLYHITDTVKGERAPLLQVVVPVQVQHVVLEQIHCSPHGGGHMSADRTYDQIKRRYYWRGMYRDTVKFVSQCDLCNARKGRQNKVPILSMPIPNHPFQIIGIDTCGPFQQSNHDNKYILTIVDHLSGWPEAFALKNKSAKSVAEVLLNEVIPRHGCPQTIISDRGTEFVNAVIGDLTRQLRVAHIRTSPYHPQSNGKTERFHRYMNDCLAKYSHREPRDWDLYIPTMLMAYRVITNETTEKSPFLFMYGRDPVLPIDTLLQPKLKYMGDDYVPTTLQRLHHVFLDAKQNIRATQDTNQRLANKNSKQETFSPGDAVHYYDISYSQNQEQTPKLQSKWKPFWRIVEQTGPVNYKIRHQVTGVTKNVHQKDLKKVDPSDCWEKQYESYSDFTTKKADPSEMPRRQVLPRLAKISAPLSDPTVVHQNPDDNVAQSGQTNDVIQPLRLQRTTDGWKVQDDDPEDMDVSCIILYTLNSPIKFA
jgi:transposase InsO family protein